MRTQWTGEPVFTSDIHQFWKPDPNAKLLAFQKDGKTAFIDVVDGKMEYTGDLPVGESAQLLFDWLARNMPALLIAKFGREAIAKEIPMTFDKPEHKELVLDMINKVSVPGQLLELFYELKKAAEAASIAKQGKAQAD